MGPESLPTRLERSGTGWRARLARPVDGAGLAVFRLVFGAIACASALRFLAKGWVEELYTGPSFHFTYLGFDWVQPWPAPWMTLHVALLALLGGCIACGVLTRWAAALHALGFTWVELIEKSAYLNHYYLVSLISLLLVVLPSDATWSVAAWWRARRGREAPVVRLAHYGLLRAQLAIVYFFAGAAKLNGDWLLRAQPLRIWLRHFWEWPVVGPVFAWPGTAHGMSWFGAVFDLGVALAMSFRRTRPLAWLLAVAFHVTIGLMFPIGVFSFVMLASLTCFNEPQWPRRLLGRWAPAAAAPAPGGQVGAIHSEAGLSRSFYVFAVPYLCIQLLVPLRFALYPGRVNWTEQGFRFAWRVMLIEKTGHVDFHVTTSDPPRHWVTDGSSELTRLQLKMMSTQPDMIHEYALHLAERTRHELGVSDVAVRADAWVAFNGRRSQRLVDPEVDLAAQPRSLAHSSWILPLR